MRKATTVQALTELGRVRLSKSFFMRDMLHSEIVQIYGLLNAPHDPELAIAAGRHLCEELLEPLQDEFGRLAIRSAYRSSEVNEFGWRMQKDRKKGYNCASNAAGHIWDRRDANGFMRVTACVALQSERRIGAGAGLAGYQVT
jgi:hypothetical protein